MTKIEALKIQVEDLLKYQKWCTNMEDAMIMADVIKKKVQEIRKLEEEEC